MVAPGSMGLLPPEMRLMMLGLRRELCTVVPSIDMKEGHLLAPWIMGDDVVVDEGDHELG